MYKSTLTYIGDIMEEKDLKERLQEFLALHRITQLQLAKETGLHRLTVKRFLADHRASTEWGHTRDVFENWLKKPRLLDYKAYIPEEMKEIHDYLTLMKYGKAKTIEDMALECGVKAAEIRKFTNPIILKIETIAKIKAWIEKQKEKNV